MSCQLLAHRVFACLMDEVVRILLDQLPSRTHANTAIKQLLQDSSNLAHGIEEKF